MGIVYFAVSNTQNYIKLAFNEYIVDEQNLINLNESEKENIDILFNLDNQNNISAKSMSNNNINTQSERYLLINDFDNISKYLYAEYTGGGYAIYDRLEQFLYEKSIYGNGPYNEYDETDSLYYAGPSNFYIKENNRIKHIITDEIITEDHAISLSQGIINIRTAYEKHETDVMTYSSMLARDSKVFGLGENLPLDNIDRSNILLYFIVKAMNYEESFNRRNTIQIWHSENNPDSRFNFTDSFYGINSYGSCSFVALSTIMNYYDRFGVANMIPDDISNFDLMYSYPVSFVSDYYASNLSHLGDIYYGNLAQINKNMMRTEFLHQQLLFNTFPELRGYTNIELNNMSNSSSLFAYDSLDLGSVYNTYAMDNNLIAYQYLNRNGTYLLPEKIVVGDPCIVSLYNGYPHSGSIADRHAAVAYAFTGNKVIWYNVDSIYCDYGWKINDGTNYSYVEVNSNFIDDNCNFEVFS